MDIEEFLNDEPKFHLDHRTEPISWGLDRQVLQRLAARTSEGGRTLETGSGLSTIVFLLNGCRHCAITPARDEIEKIRTYCDSHGISLDDCRFELGRSETVLPRLEIPPVDLVLVDGRHGFPAPFIDWYYGGVLLRVGGLMVVDDVGLRTGALLHEFMSNDRCWKLREDLGKTVFFEKVGEDFHLAEWTDQPEFFREPSDGN